MDSWGLPEQTLSAHWGPLRDAGSVCGDQLEQGQYLPCSEGGVIPAVTERRGIVLGVLSVRTCLAGDQNDGS